MGAVRGAGTVLSECYHRVTMTNFDATHYPYASRRTVVYANRGMVATSQPLAAQAGLAVLQAGGNAIDAAIATAAALTVVEPTANGIGGDSFALVWHGGKLHGLNASGPAPRSLTLDHMTGLGHTSMPKYGPLPVTVPGAPAAWAALASRFGRLPLTMSLARRPTPRASEGIDKKVSRSSMPAPPRSRRASRT